MLLRNAFSRDVAFAWWQVIVTGPAIVGCYLLVDQRFRVASFLVRELDPILTLPDCHVDVSVTAAFSFLREAF